MAIQVLSDLHLEAPKAYDVFEIAPKAPYLALLGDIGNVAAHKQDFLAFLTRQLRQFRAVLFVPGNHEAYHSNWPDTLAILRAFEDETRKDPSLGEFVLLDRGVFRLPDSRTVVLGCSLFSHVPPDRHAAVSMGLNDFFQTGGGWDVDAHNEMHRRDLAWLNAQVAELEASSDDVRIAILSHWSPTLDPRAIDPRHAGSPITSAFSTDLSGERCFRSDRVKVWAFGHTHYNCDFVVQRPDGASPLRLVANQRGYYFAQSNAFDGEKTVEV
ncbi:35ea45ce-7097-4dca-8079-7adc355c0586 [Thermothielavioides terrestris]|nr:35ea45ce-7097-4dca-8079-7adc355c0586 [Thermothielavioides terrestris]